jgi:molybdopterin synthase sulfur carrier subunit
MKLCVQYMAQLRPLMNRDEEHVTVPDHCSVTSLLALLSAQQPNAADHLLTAAGHVRPSLLIAVNGAAVATHEAATRQLAAGDVVTLLPPIAGG